MNCNTTHYRANSSSVPGDPTYKNKGVRYTGEKLRKKVGKAGAAGKGSK